jgi:hypothetical protein
MAAPEARHLIKVAAPPYPLVGFGSPKVSESYFKRNWIAPLYLHFWRNSEYRKLKMFSRREQRHFSVI